MSKNSLNLVASVLILLGFALIVAGLQGRPLLWKVGLAVEAVALVLSLGTQWAKEKAPPDDVPG